MKKIKRLTPEPVPAKPYECLYHIKIHLLDINPQVYRRFIVRGDTTASAARRGSVAPYRPGSHGLGQ